MLESITVQPTESLSGRDSLIGDLRTYALLLLESSDMQRELRSGLLKERR